MQISTTKVKKKFAWNWELCLNLHWQERNPKVEKHYD